MCSIIKLTHATANQIPVTIVHIPGYLLGMLGWAFLKFASVLEFLFFTDMDDQKPGLSCKHMCYTRRKAIFLFTEFLTLAISAGYALYILITENHLLFFMPDVEVGVVGQCVHARAFVYVPFEQVGLGGFGVQNGVYFQLTVSFLFRAPTPQLEAIILNATVPTDIGTDELSFVVFIAALVSPVVACAVCSQRYSRVTFKFKYSPIANNEGTDIKCHDAWLDRPCCCGQKQHENIKLHKFCDNSCGNPCVARLLTTSPEAMLVIFDILFFGTFAVGWIMTYIWNYEAVSDNAITRVFKRYNMCIGVDSYPARCVLLSLVFSITCVLSAAPPPTYHTIFSARHFLLLSSQICDGSDVVLCDYGVRIDRCFVL